MAPAPETARVERVGDLQPALDAFGLGSARPTLVLIGGAGELDDGDRLRLEPLFDELAGAADRLGFVVVDGGTDAGVMRLLGRARAARGGAFPLVGVVPAALAGTEAALEPGHSHVVLVPGDQWGDETPWLLRVAALLAGDRPSVTLLVNGGAVALGEVAASIEADRPVLVAGGSGRAADTLAAALRGEPAEDRVQALVDSGGVRLGDSAGAIVGAIEEALSGGR